MATRKLVLDVAGREVTVSNPDKVYFPRTGHTKLDLVNYYLAVADGALRGVADRCPAVFVSGTDLPFLHPDLVRALAAARAEHDVAVPVADGHVHHLCAVYRTDLLPAVERQLAGDRLRVGLLLEGLDVLRLEANALPHPESLRNLNTHDSYRQALAEPQPRIALPAGSLRAATLGEAIRLTPALAAELPARTLRLNGAAIEPDPTTPLVEGDVLDVT